MPITARLSPAFYEKLGEQVTNELVDWFNQVDAHYQQSLREINEHNFERFDARQAQRISELHLQLSTEFRTELQAALKPLTERVDAMQAVMATKAELLAMQATTKADMHAMQAVMATKAETATKAELAALSERLDARTLMQLRWMIGLMLPLWGGMVGLLLR